MNINVNGKEYALEYTFEAALDKKCVDMCWNFFSGAYIVKGQPLVIKEQKSDMKGQTPEEGKDESVSKALTIDKIIDGMAEAPRVALYLFYAGLLENHSDEIKSEEYAKALFKEFRKENKGDERATFTGMLNAIRNQMEEDGFFKDIGLQEFMDSMENAEQTEEVQNPPKTPQDHKKKTNHSTN